MDEQAPRLRVFGNRFADAVGPGGVGTGIDRCSCFDQHRVQAPGKGVHFHSERQDTSAPGWLHMLALIDEAAADGREVFKPLVEMSPEERRQVITLPSSIGKLSAVKHLVLYQSNLVRLPNSPFTERGIRQVWLSARVATDVLPLLVNACSDACARALPQGAEHHVRVPHSGGRDVVQPEAC